MKGHDDSRVPAPGPTYRPPRLGWRPARVRLTARDHAIAQQRAEAQFAQARELDGRANSFGPTSGHDETAVYYGELGELAVERELTTLRIPFVPGLKSVAPPEDITHDFYAAGRSIGVKTEVPDWCRSVWQFATDTRYGCTYAVRAPESGDGDTSGYPDLMVHCLYFPRVHRDELWISGFVDRATLAAAPVERIFDQPTHCVPPERFTPIEMIHAALY